MVTLQDFIHRLKSWNQLTRLSYPLWECKAKVRYKFRFLFCEILKDKLIVPREGTPEEVLFRCPQCQIWSID